MLCSITPLLRVKVPPRSPYGLKPLISWIASPANQRTDLFCEFGSFFSFSPFSIFFGHVFLAFLTPLYAYMCGIGLLLDLNSEFYHLSLESEKNGPWLSIISIFSIFFQYVVVFAHLGSSFSPLLRLKVPPGSPSGTVPIISCITSPTNWKTGSCLQIWFIFFHFLPFVCFFDAFFGNFWPPSMVIWGPKVSIWTLTPNLMNYLAKQPKNISCLQI